MTPLLPSLATNSSAPCPVWSVPACCMHSAPSWSGCTWALKNPPACLGIEWSQHQNWQDPPVLSCPSTQILAQVRRTPLLISHTPSPSMALVRRHSPSIQIPHFYNPPHRPWVMHIQLQQPGWQDSSLSQFRTLKTSFWWLLRLEQSEDSSGSFYKKFTNLKTNNLN